MEKTPHNTRITRFTFSFHFSILQYEFNFFVCVALRQHFSFLQFRIQRKYFSLLKVMKMLKKFVSRALILPADLNYVHSTLHIKHVLTTQ